MKAKQRAGRPPKNPDETRSEVIKFYTTPAHKEALDQLVSAHGKRSRSELLNELISRQGKGIKVQAVDKTAEYIFSRYSKLSTRLSQGMEFLQHTLAGSNTQSSQPIPLSTKQEAKVDELIELTTQMVAVFDEMANKSWKAWYQKYQEDTP